MKMFSVVSAVLFLAPFNPALSQAVPSCSNIGQDADGDGFGWVINPDSPSDGADTAFDQLVPHSCVVDESTETTPVLINRETGTEIQLVRQYWDPNVDLVGKTLQCEEYSFEDTSNSYELRESYQRFHHQLPEKKPYLGIWEQTNRVFYTDGIPSTSQRDTDQNYVWSVVDGVLADKLRVAYGNRLDARDYWVELISVNGGVNNATRWWSGYNTSSYHQCTDPATNRFVPTGTPGAASSAVSGFSEESLIFTSVTGNSQPASPHRYGADGPNDVADGPEAILSNGAMWDVQNLAYLRIHCPLYYEEALGSGANSIFNWRYSDSDDYTLMFLPPTEDSPRAGYQAVDFRHVNGDFSGAIHWSIADDNTISNSRLGSEEWFELASDDNGNDVLRYWQPNGGLRICQLLHLQFDSAFDLRPTTQDEYDNWLNKTNVDTSHCTTAENAYPLTVRSNSCRVDNNAAVTSDESITDDSNASENTAEGQGPASQCIDLDGDGFGWDGTSTCTPTNNPVVMSATGCDYTDAALFDGWGWNAATGESCPPLDSTGNQPANNQPTSSQPVSAQCIDADGDGFGWDGTSTCIPGTNNTTASNNTAAMDCDYTDADRFGGWGWNPTTRQSCAPLTDMIAQPSAAQPQSAQCIDTDGDGFGWNGTATCIP